MLGQDTRICGWPWRQTDSVVGGPNLLLSLASGVMSLSPSLSVFLWALSLREEKSDEGDAYLYSFSYLTYILFVCVCSLYAPVCTNVCLYE